MKQVALEVKARELKVLRAGNDDGRSIIAWNSCAPFVDNSRGPLIHRPRSVTVLKIHKYPHMGIKYWCGGHVVGDNKFTFSDKIDPNGKPLCARCEAMAIQNGFPSADELNGEHVHIGKVVAVRMCHSEGGEE